jgi:hypothetical protein
VLVRDDGKRLALAFALAIALHEILAGLIPSGSPPPAPREIVSHIRILHVAMHPPTPTPSPKPVPTPRRIVSRARTIAPPETKRVARATGASAHREPVRRAGAPRPKPPKVVNSKPVWDIPVGGQGAGAGKASGAGSLGSGGAGTGAGAEGSGSGAAAATEPCGFVTFMDPHGAQYDRQTHGFWVDVQMSVHFPDGHSQTMLLDYPWYYPSANANPFENQNAPMLFQWPPPALRAGEPPLVQYVMQHSAPPGITLLKDCPG